MPIQAMNPVQNLASCHQLTLGSTPFRYDVTMADLRKLLFNEQPADSRQQKKRRRGWWAKHFGGCASWHLCSAEPVRGEASHASADTLVELQVQLDLGGVDCAASPPRDCPGMLHAAEGVYIIYTPIHTLVLNPVAPRTSSPPTHSACLTQSAFRPCFANSAISGFLLCPPCRQSLSPSVLDDCYIHSHLDTKHLSAGRWRISAPG